MREPRPVREFAIGSGQDDFILRLYLRDARRQALLTEDEENAAGWLASFDDAGARRQLVLGKLRLVVRIAFEYRGLGLPLGDLINEGNLGLMRAAELFDPVRGTRFATYAQGWIRQRMRRALSYQAWPVRLPADFLWSNNPARPKPAPRFLSLESPVQQDEDSPTLGETIPDERVPNPAEALSLHSDRQLARRLLATLNAKEQRVLGLRFGFDGGGERTLDEVGRTLGYVRQGIHKIESAALAKLRRRVKTLPNLVSGPFDQSPRPRFEAGPQGSMRWFAATANA